MKTSCNRVLYHVHRVIIVFIVLNWFIEIKVIEYAAITDEIVQSTEHQNTLIMQYNIYITEQMLYLFTFESRILSA